MFQYIINDPAMLEVLIHYQHATDLPVCEVLCGVKPKHVCYVMYKNRG